MKKTAVIMLLLVFAIFSAACSDKEEEVYISEKEKLIVNIDLEKRHHDDLFELVEGLTPEEVVEVDENVTVEIFNPDDFAGYTLPEGFVTEATKTIGPDSEGNETESISVDYKYRSHRIIVDYFLDGSINKFVLNTNSGEVLVNENDENYRKMHIDDLQE